MNDYVLQNTQEIIYQLRFGVCTTSLRVKAEETEKEKEKEKEKESQRHRNRHHRQ